MNCSRRHFLATSAFAALGASAASTVRPKHKYIDIHTHLYFTRLVGAKGLLEWMDAHDVERAVIQPLVSPESAPTLHPLQTNDAALDAARAHPDRLIAFCCLDPRVTVDPTAIKTFPTRQGHVAGTKGLIDILKRYKDAGARGLGEHKVGLPFDHPQMMQLYAACDALELPILFHLDDLRGIDTVGLPRLENALKAFPKLPLIGHACGFWSSISGDATKEDFGRYPKVPPDWVLEGTRRGRPAIRRRSGFSKTSSGSAADGFSRLRNRRVMCGHRAMAKSGNWSKRTRRGCTAICR
jgi:predicted TIM-barrel fold metal-dependent hydrolase